MIVIHIDTQKDTSFLKKTYEGIDNLKLLYNPTKAEVNKTLKENPTEDVMMLGHGSTSGLFNHDFKSKDYYIIGYDNVELLKNRNCIGIWCYAKEFARKYALKGYFTSMFISNGGEAKSFGFSKATEEDVFNEVQNFSAYVNMLIKDNTPYEEWVESLQSMVDMGKDFVEFNYSAMEYFDGTQKPTTKSYYDYEGSKLYGTSGKTYGYGKGWYEEEDEEIEREKAFNDFCKEQKIESDIMKDIVRKAFYEGWKSYEDYLYGYGSY